MRTDPIEPRGEHRSEPDLGRSITEAFHDILDALDAARAELRTTDVFLQHRLSGPALGTSPQSPPLPHTGWRDDHGRSRPPSLPDVAATESSRGSASGVENWDAFRPRKEMSPASGERTTVSEANAVQPLWARGTQLQDTNSAAAVGASERADRTRGSDPGSWSSRRGSVPLRSAWDMPPTGEAVQLDRRSDTPQSSSDTEQQNLTAPGRGVECNALPEADLPLAQPSRRRTSGQFSRSTRPVGKAGKLAGACGIGVAGSLVVVGWMLSSDGTSSSPSSLPSDDPSPQLPGAGGHAGTPNPGDAAAPLPRTPTPRDQQGQRSPIPEDQQRHWFSHTQHNGYQPAGDYGITIQSGSARFQDPMDSGRLGQVCRPEAQSDSLPARFPSAPSAVNTTPISAPSPSATRSPGHQTGELGTPSQAATPAYHNAPGPTAEKTQANTAPGQGQGTPVSHESSSSDEHVGAGQQDPTQQTGTAQQTEGVEPVESHRQGWSARPAPSPEPSGGTGAWATNGAVPD